MNQEVGTLMEMDMRRTKSISGVTRKVGNRIAVLALSAFMLGVVINGGVPVADAAAASQDFPPGPYATSQDYPPGPYVTSQDFPPGPTVAGIVIVG
jgi:hypothetical protein